MKERDLVINGVYRHFKGELYQVMTVATQTETGEKLVIYMNQHGVMFARPYAMFLGLVDKRKYPNATQKYRLELVKPNNQLERED